MGKKRILCLLLCVLLLCAGAAFADGGAGTAQAGVYTSLSQLSGRRIGVQTGSIQVMQVEEQFPDAELFYFNSDVDMLNALRANRIDAFATAKVLLEYMAEENPDLTCLDEKISGGMSAGAVFPKTDSGRALCDQFSAFIREIRQNGVFREIEDTWFGDDEDRRAVPDLYHLEAKNGTLRMAADTSLIPFVYIKNGQPVGLDVDTVVRFCREYGYGLEIVQMDFSGIIPSVITGKVDFACSGIAYTDERAESVLFSEPTYESVSVMAVLRDPGSAQTAAAGIASLDELAGCAVGVQTGTICDRLAQQRIPNVRINYYNAQTDALIALQTGKTDGWCCDEPIARYMTLNIPEMVILKEPLADSNLAAVFPKTDAGQKLRDQYSEFVDRLWADGTMAEIDAVWFGTDEKKRTIPDYTALPDTNGTLRMAVDATIPPFTFVKDGRVVGYDVDIAARFCEAYGYRLEITQMTFDSVLAAVQTGKCDFAASCITITEERQESMLFSSANYRGGIVMTVMKTRETAAAAPQETSFWDGIAASFEKTFIREDRWKLFVDGLLTTLLITVLAVLFGTLLGFLVFMLCRNGNAVANAVTRFCMWLVQGMPMVVLLMILYYIIFGSMAVSGIAVAVIGFTLTFGASVFSLLKMGVGTIDPGQYEASYALGYSNWRTFFRIILPQAVPRVLPAYRGEIVGLIKATAIVGYIAVQDLTKMGDIVRSRTYEAFFPLIAITVIYFLLEELLILLINRIQIRMNPRRRKPESILKGVNLHD